MRSIPRATPGTGLPPPHELVRVLAAIGLVRLVEHDDVAQHPDRVEQTVPDRAAVPVAFEIGVPLQQLVV